MFILFKVLLGYMFGTNMVFLLQTVEELLISVSIKNDHVTLKVGQGHRYQICSRYSLNTSRCKFGASTSIAWKFKMCLRAVCIKVYLKVWCDLE